jgi:hypothetical protein
MVWGTMDYLSFVSGLGLLTLAIISINLNQSKDALLPWKWLARFSLICAVDEWLELISTGFGKGSFYASIGTAFDCLGLLCLIEFGRIGLSSARGRKSSRLIYIPILILLYLDALLEPYNITFLSKQGLGILAGIWASYAVYYTASGVSWNIRRSLYTLAVGIGLYGILTTLSAPQIQYYPVPFNTFLKDPRLVLELLRTVMTLCAAIAIWAYTHSPKRSAYGAETPTKVPTIIAPILLVVIILCGWLLTDLVGRRTDESFRGNLLARTLTAASAIDPLQVIAIKDDIADLSLPSYTRVCRQLKVIHEANRDCQYIYIMALHHNQITFLAESGRSDGTGNTPPGYIYQEEPQNFTHLSYENWPLSKGLYRIVGESGFQV